MTALITALKYEYIVGGSRAATNSKPCKSEGLALVHVMGCIYN